ncbi:MAG: peptide deformylase [Calditrichia bacterium]
MAILPVIKIGHPTLRKKAKVVTDFDDKLKTLVENMIETMRLNDGIGLAAPQVNVSQQLFVVDMPLIDETLPPKAFINPEILESRGSEPYEEGCLSIPGIRADVIRPTEIKVAYQDLDGKRTEEWLSGLTARVFQHEYDHLNGVLFVDKISPLQKKLLEPKINELMGIYS